MAAGRTIAAWFPQTAPVYCEIAGLDPALIAQVRAMYEGGEFQEAAAAAKLLPDDFVRRMAIVGNRASVAEHIETLDGLGVDSFTVFPIGGDATTRMATIEAFAGCMADAGHGGSTAP